MTATSGTSRQPVVELDVVDVPSSIDPGVVVVRNLNWSVAEGESWLVWGPARGGKSSVLAVAAGLVRPVTGQVRLFGEELALLREEERAARRLRVGMVFGGGGRLFSRLTVAENVVLPVQYHESAHEPVDLAIVEPMMEGLGVSALSRRLPQELPRWAAQRVALARALVLQPEVLMLDDPTEGLPYEEVDWWVSLVMECTAGRCPAGSPPRTIVVAASNPRPWLAWAEQYAVVRDRTWEVGPRPPPASGAGLRPTDATGS